MLAAVRPAPSREHADAGLALMIDDVVGIEAGISRLAVEIDDARQTQPRAQIEHHILEGPHIAIGRHHRLADGVARGIGLADRPVEQRDAIMALEIRRVRQHEIGIGDHLGEVRIGVDDMRDAILAALASGRSASRRARACSWPSSSPCSPCRGTAYRSDRDRARQALRMTICIRPCAASGASQL